MALDPPAHNPYTAPNAALLTPNPPLPAQIKVALALLVIVLLIDWLWPLSIALATMPQGDVLKAVMVALILSGGPLLKGVMLLFVGLRHNWARWVWLVFFALSVAFTLRDLGGEASSGMLSVSMWMLNGLNLVGTVLLFVGPGAHWFKAQKDVNSGARIE